MESSVLMNMNALGKIVDVQISEADATALAAHQREWETEKRRRRNEAIAAIRRNSEAPTLLTYETALDGIKLYSGALSSEARLPDVLSLIERAPLELFWARIDRMAAQL
jgi:hypothetical protein